MIPNYIPNYLKDEMSDQVEKEFLESTFCGGFFEIDAHLSPTNSYMIFYEVHIKGSMDFEIYPDYKTRRIFGLDRIFHKEELEIPDFRKLIVEDIDRTLQDLIKKTKIEVVQRYPTTMAVTFRCRNKSSRNF